jgi:hypothetical protein
MVEHLTSEQIAAMVDEPESIAGGLVHLESCESCALEFEGMSRMRMALSGLPDLPAPEGEWEAIQARLPRRMPAAWTRTFWTPPVAAAAVILLFMGGLAVGRAIAPTTGPNQGSEQVADVAAADVPAQSDRVNEYLRTVDQLQELRDAGPVGPAVVENPALAAERLTRLDALIDATRETLRIAPADPALNDFLFDVVDERESLAGQLNQTLRQASMEY